MWCEETREIKHPSHEKEKCITLPSNNDHTVPQLKIAWPQDVIPILTHMIILFFIINFILGQISPFWKKEKKKKKIQCDHCSQLWGCKRAKKHGRNEMRGVSHMKREADREHMSALVCFLEHISLSLCPSRSAHIYTAVRQTVHLSLYLPSSYRAVHAMTSSYTIAHTVPHKVCVWMVVYKSCTTGLCRSSSYSSLLFVHLFVALKFISGLMGF